MQCPLLNCSILVKAVVVVLMVCSLSSFPRPQPQCSPYKNSLRVCAYEEDCAVQCMCTRERLCVQWRRWRASSSSPPPVAQTPPAAIAPSGGGGGGCARRRIFCRIKPGQSKGAKRNGCFCKDFCQRLLLCHSMWYCVVLSICCVYNKNYHQHLIIDISLTCVGSGARWGVLQHPGGGALVTNPPSRLVTKLHQPWSSSSWSKSSLLSMSSSPSPISFLSRYSKEV